MRRFLKSGYLGETSESFIQERRVLSVQSSYKRSVSGAILGSSKTGNLTYIEPQANVPLNHEIEALQDDEQKEIRRILWTLTQELRVFFPLIKAYQQSLVSLDIVNAKVKLAESMVILAPMVQLGCFNACARVTFANWSFVNPLKGPPEAVKIIFSMGL